VSQDGYGSGGEAVMRLPNITVIPPTVTSWICHYNEIHDL